MLLFSKYFCIAFEVFFPTLKENKTASDGVPFLPALPVSCKSSSSVQGAPQLITLVISPQSTPKPNALMAITNLRVEMGLQNSRNTCSLI